MKNTISFLCGILLMMTVTITAYATGETIDTQNQTETSPCTHNWVEGNGIAATCTTVGERNFTCSLCSETKKETVAALGHSYGTETPVDDSNHVKTCSVCNASETAAHSWGEGSVTTQASCTAEGLRTFTCTCGKTKTEKILKLEHDFNAWTKADASNHERGCKNCTHKESGRHNWQEEVIKAATCKEDGSKKKTCMVCGTGEIIVVSKLTTHTYDNVCDPDCNVCGEKRTTSHAYGSSWSRDYSGHWHECTKCGEKKDFRSHYPGPAATEDAPQTCVTCDYVITAQKEHKHSFAKTWSRDDSGHWYVCSSCDEKKDFAKHVYDSACDEDCNICDYENPNVHNYGNSWENDEKLHWKVCKICKETSEPEKHIAGPEATDTQAQLCTVCSYEITPIQEHEHAFGPDWMHDGKTHWQICTCGEQSVPAEHTWDDGTKNRDKTVTYLCTQCQAERTEEVSGFPWWVLILLLLLAAAGGATIYVFYIVPQKQGGKFVSQ